MDIKPPTYEQLVDLTQRLARQIDELPAEVDRLKAELEQSKRGLSVRPNPFPREHPKPTLAGPDASQGTRPAIRPTRRPTGSADERWGLGWHLVSDPVWPRLHVR